MRPRRRSELVDLSSAPVCAQGERLVAPLRFSTLYFDEAESLE